MGGRPVLRLRLAGGERFLFDLADGREIEGVTEAAAAAVAAVYAGRHGLDLAGPPRVADIASDEWVVTGYFNRDRPYWRVSLDDPAKTTLYISQKTGEVRQRTTAHLRFWNWFGAIPHWLYFEQLRADVDLWDDVMVATSIAGTFLTALGLFVGLRQFRRRRSTGKRDSPYRGARYWHHMLGLAFGVVTLTWVFSGVVSMQPWGLLSPAPLGDEAARRLEGPAPAWPATHPVLERQLAALPQGVVQLRMARLAGEPWFVRVDAAGVETRVDDAGAPAPFEPQWTQAAHLLAGEGAPVEVELLTREDAYWYVGGDDSPGGGLPILRVIAPELEGTRFYLDPATGELQAVADPASRGYRWLHMGLHRLDFVGWLRARPVWDVVMLSLLAGASALTGFGAFLGMRKLVAAASGAGRRKREAAGDVAAQKGAALSKARVP
jgi:hypothetical protein